MTQTKQRNEQTKKTENLNLQNKSVTGSKNLEHIF